jgi:multiple sugar transport system ATP-binding protein
MREQYRIKLVKLLNEFNVTTVFVTHDQHEAGIVGNAIALMNKGRIVQMGTLTEMYRKPNCLFTARFINPRQEAASLNLVNGRIISEDYVDTDCGFRPEDAEIIQSGPVQATLLEIRDLPFSEYRLAVVEVRGVQCDILFRENLPTEPGDDCAIRINKFHVFNRKTGLRMETVQSDPVRR